MTITIVTVVGFCADVFAWQQTRRVAHLKRDPNNGRWIDTLLMQKELESRGPTR